MKENMRALCRLIYKYAIPRGYTVAINMAEYLKIVAASGSTKQVLSVDAVLSIESHVKDVPGAGYVLCQCYLVSLEVCRAIFYRLLDYCRIDNPVDGEGNFRRRRYTPHSCLYAFATWMKCVPGADKDKLELMGHTSSEMLWYYREKPQTLAVLGLFRLSLDCSVISELHINHENLYLGTDNLHF